MTATGSHFDFDSLRGAPLARNDFVLFGHFAILRQLHQTFILFPFLPCFSGKSREAHGRALPAAFPQDIGSFNNF